MRLNPPRRHLNRSPFNGALYAQTTSSWKSSIVASAIPISIKCATIGASLSTTTLSSRLFAFSTWASSLHQLRMQTFDLIWRRDFYLRLPFVKLDSSGYADDFPFER